MIMNGRSALPRGPAFEVFSGVGTFADTAGNRAKAGKAFERKTKRHMTATGNARRKYAVRIDADSVDEVCRPFPVKKPHVVDVELVRAVVTDVCTRFQ